VALEVRGRSWIFRSPMFSVRVAWTKFVPSSPSVLHWQCGRWAAADEKVTGRDKALRRTKIDLN
jgi:hypothetical protein